MQDRALTLGRIKNKYLLIDLFGYAYGSTDTQSLLFSLSKRYRNFLITNRDWYLKALNTKQEDARILPTDLP